MQATKRLAQLVLDTDRDVLRLTYTLRSFERLSAAQEAQEVEATLAECLVDALGLASVRLYVVDRRRRRATSCSGPKTTTTWKGGAMEQQASLVAWCAHPASLPRWQAVTKEQCHAPLPTQGFQWLEYPTNRMLCLGRFSAHALQLHGSAGNWKHAAFCVMSSKSSTRVCAPWIMPHSHTCRHLMMCESNTELQVDFFLQRWSLAKI